MKHFISLFVVLLICLSSRLPKESGNWTLVYNNGEQVTGEVEGFHSAAEIIKFKNGESRKKEKIKSSDLEKMILNTGDEELVFEKMKWKYFSGLGKVKEPKELAWVAKLYATDKMEAYFFSSSDYNFTANAIGGTMTTHFLTQAQAIRVLPEDYIFYAGVAEFEGAMNGKSAARTMMNNILKRYLKDFCPSFASGLNKKSYETSELQKMIDDYTAACD